MATIKALEGRTVHQIQSGQVIVDLCSVVKELVENSLDAEASSIEVRFKNNGLEAIEVQDNGVGISRENYDTIALKHYTSKLSSYDDLTSLTTFGFRGEALSSLCALSSFHIITARADEAPKGTRLDFEISGRLKGTQVVASQKGTTVVVENLFMNLPVRRRELEKNIKREYGKVVGLLQAYACISINTKFVVSNMMAKGKKVVVFATKGNPTTRENIANVYGAKALPGLVALDLRFEMKPTRLMQSGTGRKQVHVLGHVSKPIFGEGRQAPDRQMFFVNGRPCALPQVSKVFNEVYKSYNLSQSPFIFSDIVLDTNAYDVNVSPDKRTILLHDQQALLENLRGSLIDLFDKQDQTVPQSQKIGSMLSFKPSNPRRESSNTQNSESGSSDIALQTPRLGEKYIETYNSISSNRDSKAVRDEEDLESKTRQSALGPKPAPYADRSGLGDNRTLANRPGKVLDNTVSGPRDEDDTTRVLGKDVHAIKVGDFNRRLAEQQPKHELILEASQSTEPEFDDKLAERNDDPRDSPNIHEGSIVKNAFDRMRPKRKSPEMATITIGSTTTTEVIGSPYSKRQKVRDRHGPLTKSRRPATREHSIKKFGSNMRAFTAPGTRTTESALWIADIGDNDDPEDVERSSSKIQDDGQSASHNEEGSENADQLSENESDSSQLDASEKQEESREGGGGLNEDSATTEVEGKKSPVLVESDEDSDGGYIDEKVKREKEAARVARLIQQAEGKMAMPRADNMKRSHQILTGKGQKASTRHLRQVISSSVDEIEKQIHSLRNRPRATTTAITQSLANDTTPNSEASPEERLSLTVSKEDFAHMHIVGQFNLGFILALRPSSSSSSASSAELFIIDQHASDEKYNFERLQSSTVVQNQRLVHPRTLHLTAIEEEIILENNATLLNNGFLVAVDDSGDLPVGQRCKLLSLPMSREITFSLADLEELIAILADSPLPSLPSASSPSSSPTSNNNNINTNTNTNTNNKVNINIPRPSAIRKMFAMRACRSSIMIGKTLSKSQMAKVVKNMGELDKPWNCPHGRPTMRHLFGLTRWRGNGWDGDGDGFGNDDDGDADDSDDDDDDGGDGGVKGGVDWKGFVRMERVEDAENENENENEEEEEEEEEEED